MLLKNFFDVINIENNGEDISSVVNIDKSHQIFEGHFPNNPVTPGVVQIQMVKEILEQALNTTLHLSEMGRCKFLAILDPRTENEIIIKISYSLINHNELKISAQGNSKNEDTTFFKFSARYLKSPIS